MENFISCGIPYIDRLTGGILLGDNVAWVLEPGMYFDYFLESYFTAPHPSPCKNIYVTFDFPPQKIYTRYHEFTKHNDLILVDAFTYGKGKGDSFFQSFHKKDAKRPKQFRLVPIKNLNDPEEFIETMSSLQREFQDTALCKYVFYSLTGMQALWGERDTLHFFTYTCPKLYELKSLAYWPLVREAHSKAFLASISYITQLVISLSPGRNNTCVAKFLKMDGRPSHLLNTNHYYAFQDNKITFSEPPRQQAISKGSAAPGSERPGSEEKFPGFAGAKRSFKIGDRIRAYRLENNISQVELARTLKVTPSALSQIENNLSYPSLHLFIDIARHLGKPLDSFIGAGDTRARGMRMKTAGRNKEKRR